MDSADSRQLEEINVIQSIYSDDFFESPPPTVWKGAARLLEYTMRIKHTNSRYADKIFLHLNIKYPKTYPEKAPPIFTIVEPVSGITKQQYPDIQVTIREEAQKMKGQLMVFEVITKVHEWLERNVRLPAESAGASLASEMEMRTSDEQRAQQERAIALAKKKDEIYAQEAAALRQQIQEDFRKREEMERIEKERNKARRRAMSDVTERPTQGITIEKFDDTIEIDGIPFDTVKLFHGRSQCLGVTFAVEPICDGGFTILRPLELHAVDFDSNYYATNQGRKKLRQVESEIRKLMKIKEEGILRIYGVQLRVPKSNESSRLLVLMEKQPSMTLRDVLLDCECLKEERASDYLAQILTALNAIHAADLQHRNISVSTIGLVDRNGDNNRKALKLMKSSFYTLLNNLHKSDPFGPKARKIEQDPQLPEEWLSNEAIEDPLVYTRSRDIHSVGVVLLQMLMGLDVVEQFPGPQAALQAATFSPVMVQLASDMLSSSKQRSCMSLLLKLTQTSRSITIRGTPTRPISIDTNRTPLAHNVFSTSPENGYFRGPAARTRQASRWREDWEELEVLGKGGFGSVVKARNKIDNRVYAVKKIKLRATQADHKIFREVNALSRLTHRFIVRYFTTWLEEFEPDSQNTMSSDSETETDSSDTSVPSEQDQGDSGSGLFSIDLDDLRSENKASSFPSIIFENSRSRSDGAENGDTGSSSEEDDPAMLTAANVATPTKAPVKKTSIRTLYIQMEYVERQTLKERIAEGITEEEAWRLFQQVVDALVYMSSLGILHRDIKCTNIFIDSNGDCKIGDFGLATSSLAAVDPSDVQASPSSVSTATEVTFDVGTAYYIAPEVKHRVRGQRDQSKADMYSLGIVFFEMNHRFGTASERARVLEALRKPEVTFPADWDPKRTQQKQIITWLLQHNPADRPSALQLSQSPLMPARVEHEYFREALQMMTKPGSQQYQAVLDSLFNQNPRPSLRFLYDSGMPEHAPLRGVVVDHLVDLFRLHGAVDVETPLFLPLMKGHIHEQRQVLLIDRHGDIVTLPVNALVPFARLAARTGVTRIKRYHITDTYKEVNVMGHPKVSPAAVFDIITPDLTYGPELASAELITMMNKCLDMFPNLGQNYDIHISHSRISEAAMGRLTSLERTSVVEIMTQASSKANNAAKRTSLIKKGIPSSIADELIMLNETYEDLPSFLFKLDKLSSTIRKEIHGAIEEMRVTVEHAILSGVMRPIYVTPLMLGSRHDYFKNGVCFEVCKRNKRHDLLAAGGRYDHLITQLIAPTLKTEPICAFGLQISIERIATALATYQSTSVTNLVKEQRSFGYWSARRCDVYVVSFQEGHLQERLEVAALLWQNGISADLMYESSIADANQESFMELCHNEGILFTLFPRARREMTDYKVKSVLRGTEHEVSRQDLIPWLLERIAEQKRADMATSGVATLQADSSSPVLPFKEQSTQFDVQLVLPGDAKKVRKHSKQIFRDRAYENLHTLKSAMQTGSIPMVAIDAPVEVFEAMAKNDKWVENDEAWRTIAQGFPTQYSGYANQVREVVLRKKEDGVQFLLLFAVKEERMALINF